ncbi:MAG: hypothetical protein IT395_02555 [Candidatus Omnitrophica bacterium]|nr:hypothetical protein [Candidatus Omnitrophota bacterium]
MNRRIHKLFSAFLLIPVAILFLSCCCLKADASTVKKSSCASCPKKETSDHQTDCPHAKIKAVVDGDLALVKITKATLVLPVLLSNPQLVSSYFSQLVALERLDTSQQYSSHQALRTQNPILRV